MFNVFLTRHDGFILGPIAKLLGSILDAIFNFLAHFGIENAGLCIIVFTFLVNALMIPLTIKQQKFTKLSSKMNPEIMKVQEKYKGKKDEASLRKQQLEMQAIYEKYGANPTSGCLPMLITFPIMFALYRVIYNIPAYVDSIKLLYKNIAVKMAGTNYLGVMTDYAHQFKNLNISKWGDISSEISTDHLIDIMSQFKAADWSDLLSNNTFSSIADVIQTNSDRIMHINNFGWGVNISETPWQQLVSTEVPTVTKALYILIPILAVVTQMLQTKLMMANTPQTAGNDTAAATMKSMNTFMPLMSGAFCLTLPVGVGIYWIAGAVFRSIQQVFTNRYMERMDVDALIEKNKEKQKKKKEKLGIDPNISMEELAKTRTSSMKDKANASTLNSGEYKKDSSQGSYKKGSIAANAHMVDRNRGDKEENKMMAWEEFTAKTVNDAITEALIHFGVTSDMIEYEVIEEEKSRILGLFSRPAKIRARKKQEETEVEAAKVVTTKEESFSAKKSFVSEEKKAANTEEIEKSAVKFLTNVFKAMKIEAEITAVYKENDNLLEITMEGNDMGILIGKRGQTLDSLQYLVSLVVNKESNCYVKVKLDTENYRERRKETLENLAKNISYKVKRTKRAVSLEPMNPYERRIIHSALQGDRYVETHSEGEEPYRRVVVTLKKNYRDYNNKNGRDYKSKNDYKGNRGKNYNKNREYKKNYEKNECASSKEEEAKTEE